VAKNKEALAEVRPFLEVRIGGLHLTMQRAPYKSIILMVSVICATVSWGIRP
jgi:hypothetical protein